MKATNLAPPLTVTLGFAADGTHANWAHARADAVPPVETESSARFNAKSLAGKLDFRGDTPVLEGHPLLIAFWATWSPPCWASIAHLNKLNNSYHKRGLQIVGITSENKEVVERIRARTPIHYAVALDTDQMLATKFQVQTIPQA